MKKSLMIAVAVSMIAGSAMAGDESGRPSRAQMKEAASAMGVSTWGMGMCMKSLRGEMAPEDGSAPTEAMQAVFHDKLFVCLKGKNEDLTRDTFDTAMGSLPMPGQKK